MIEGIDAEDVPSTAPSQSPRRSQLSRQLSLPLVMLLGLFVFFTAVSVDSLQQASAADMSSQAMTTVQTPASSATGFSSRVAPSHATVAGTYLEFNEATAHRLSHSDLVGSHLTRSRLASAHLLMRNSQ